MKYFNGRIRVQKKSTKQRMSTIIDCLPVISTILLMYFIPMYEPINTQAPIYNEY